VGGAQQSGLRMHNYVNRHPTDKFAKPAFVEKSLAKVATLQSADHPRRYSAAQINAAGRQNLES
jgi:hypothetical protein